MIRSCLTRLETAIREKASARATPARNLRFNRARSTIARSIEQPELQPIPWVWIITVQLLTLSEGVMHPVYTQCTYVRIEFISLVSNRPSSRHRWLLRHRRRRCPLDRISVPCLTSPCRPFALRRRESCVIYRSFATCTARTITRFTPCDDHVTAKKVVGRRIWPRSLPRRLNIVRVFAEDKW